MTIETKRSMMPAYAASFALGVRLALRNPGDIASRTGIYAVLLTMFNAIYGAMPIEKFGMAGLTAHHLLWYFAVTEIVMVAGQGLRREMGQQIAAGELTVMMQRPGSLLAMMMTRLAGRFMTQAMLLLAFALVVLPLVAGAPLPFALWQLPVLVLSILMAAIISLLLGHLVGMVEIMGPYSQPIDWIVNKFVMALGGLFLPVMFFPPLAKQIALLTPFPSIMFAPASMMLDADMAAMGERLGMQLFWVLALTAIAMLAEARMLRVVLIKGD